MASTNINKKHLNTCKLIHRKRIADAIVLLRQMIHDTGKEYLHDRLNEHQETYTRLLKHAFTGVEDPERDKVYQYLMRTLLEMADQLRESGMIEMGRGQVYFLKKELHTRKASEQIKAMQLLEDLTFDDELAGLLKDVNVRESGDGGDRE